MSQLTKSQIDDLLRVFDLRVVFTKVDGSDRIMMCTRDPSLIPISPMKKDGPPKPPNDNLLHVYDVDSSGWRSIKVDTIKNVELWRHHEA